MDLSVAAYAFAGLIGLGLIIYLWWATREDRLKKAANRAQPDPSTGVPQGINPGRFVGGPDPGDPHFDADAFIGYVKQALKNAEAVKGLPRNQMNVVMGMQIAAQRILDDFGGSPRSKPGAVQYLQDMIETSKMNKGRLPPNRKNVAIGIEELASSLLKEINAGRFVPLAKKKGNSAGTATQAASDDAAVNLTAGTNQPVHTACAPA